MSNKPIFVATHPRACSTAFERVFMTCRDSLQCVHEPFGDAFYYGPERLGARYEKDEKTRTNSGFSNSTFETILERFDRESAEGKRLFVKDMAYYIFHPDEEPAAVAPSLARKERGVGTSHPSSNGTDGTDEVPCPYPIETEINNPMVLPEEILRRFHFAFLIRHPRSSIPSYYRCTTAPLDQVTGWDRFMPSEAGYSELRRMFDYLRTTGQVGPGVAAQGKDSTTRNANGHSGNGHCINGAHKANGSVMSNGQSNKVEICVIDADDLLDNPPGVIEAFCKSVGLKYDAKMLEWDSEEDHRQAENAFEKWLGWHDDALHSRALKPRLHKKQVKSVEDEDREWVEKYGAKGAKYIREMVDANVEDYEYLKQFAVKV